METIKFTRSEARQQYLDRKRRAMRSDWTVNRIDAVKHTVQADDSNEAHIVHLVAGRSASTWNGYENGVQQYTAGRLTFWREELLHLIHDDGRYFVVVYDEDAEPHDPDFIQRIRMMTPKEVGEVTEGSWYEGHRESKGDRAKVSWKRVLGSEPDV